MLPSGTETVLPSRLISIMSGLRSGGRMRVRADHAGLVLDVVDELVAEVLDHRAHRHRRGVAERADGSSLDVVGDRIEQVHVAGLAVAVMDTVHDAPEPTG